MSKDDYYTIYNNSNSPRRAPPANRYDDMYDRRQERVDDRGSYDRRNDDRRDVRHDDRGGNDRGGNDRGSYDRGGFDRHGGEDEQFEQRFQKMRVKDHREDYRSESQNDRYQQSRNDDYHQQYKYNKPPPPQQQRQPPPQHQRQPQPQHQRQPPPQQQRQPPQQQREQRQDRGDVGGGGGEYKPKEWKREQERSDEYHVDDILETFRDACLKRGTAGIKGFGRMFRQYDDNRDKKLELSEFKKGVREYGVSAGEVKDDELSQLFKFFDRDDSGHINYEELLQGIRPPMNEARKRLIARAFDKLDVTNDGFITVEDLIHKEGGYDVTHHPKFKSGEMTEKQVLTLFLNNFDAPRSRDGKVTREEFLDYYAGVSASIDKDVYFDLMMRQSWRLDKPSGFVVKKAKKFQF